MDFLHSNNSLPIILSGQNVFLTLTFGAVFDTQNTIPSHLNKLYNFLSGHPDIRTSGHPDIRTKQNTKSEKCEAGKKTSTRTRFFRNECASKYAMLLFYIFHSIYILLSKKQKKQKKNMHGSHLAKIGVCFVRMSGCPDVRMSGQNMEET